MRISRRSFVAAPLLMMMGVHSGCLIVCNERAQPHREQSANNVRRPQTKQELLDILQTEYGGRLDIREEWAPGTQAKTAARDAMPVMPTTPQPAGVNTQQPRIAVTPATQTAAPDAALDVRATQIAKRATCMTTKDIGDAWHWLQHYRACEESTDTLPAEAVDCNDHGNVHCHKLAFRHKVPMHLVAYWPSDAEKTGTNSWHLVAACKLDPNHYLILDNRTQATFWHGSLSQYGHTYPGRNQGWESMEVIPHVGIAKYIRPKYPHSIVGKAVLQLEGSCTEKDMETLRLQTEPTSPKTTPIRNLLALLFQE